MGDVKLTLRCEKCGRSMAYDRNLDPTIPVWCATLVQSHCDAEDCDTGDFHTERWLDRKGRERDPAGRTALHQAPTPRTEDGSRG